MNKTEQEQQFRLAADIFETGHPFEVRHDTSEKWHPSGGIHPARAVLDSWHLRPILATPPDNRPLHNPDNLTAEQVGLGYRLALVDEKTNENEALQEFWNKGKWMTSGRVYSDTFGESPNRRITYRLPLSVPWPEAKPDPYAELKAAHAAGKVIQEDFFDTWHDVTDRDPNWSLAPWLLRIKPETPPFQLPPPPPGMKWHREDGWNEGDLPQGYRPLVEGELIQSGDEVRNKHLDNFRFVKASCSVGHNAGEAFLDQFARTTRPLIFTHEGKKWTYHRPGDLIPCDSSASIHVLLFDDLACDPALQAKDIRWDAEGAGDIIGWRYAETTKTVEIGPEDVPPMCAIRCSTILANILRVCDKGVWIVGQSGKTYLVCWEELHDSWQINRSIPLTGRWNPTSWEPCHKTISPR